LWMIDRNESFLLHRKLKHFHCGFIVACCICCFIAGKDDGVTLFFCIDTQYLWFRYMIYIAGAASWNITAQWF
jgi:hypothetical protein